MLWKKRDPSKSVLMANRKGEATAYSTEETLASGRNHFKGWLCAAGTESLHVGADGGLKWAACSVGGNQGNIFRGDIRLPKDWVICDKPACMCGGDMQIRKAKTQQDKAACKKVSRWRTSLVPQVRDVAFVAPYHYPKASDQPKTISWDMGKRCNFSCSYCPPEVSNKTDPYLEWDQMKSATDLLIREFGRGQLIKWVITGGEPTIIPSYMDWVNYVRKYHHVVHTTTNGSRGGAYLADLMEVSCIGLSVHMEFMSVDRLEETCRQVIQRKLNSIQAAQWWFGIRIMVPPGQLHKALEMKARLIKIPHFRHEAHFFMSPVHRYHGDSGDFAFGELVEYDPDELKQIQAEA